MPSNLAVAEGDTTGSHCGCDGVWRNDGFQLLLPVDSRPRYVLVSSNLFDWTTQFLVAPSGLPQVLTDSMVTNSEQQFYRVQAN